MRPNETILGPPAPQKTDVGPAAVVEDALAALGRFDALTMLVNDPQRHTATGCVLAEVCRRVDPGRVRLLVAAGTHSFTASQRSDFEADLRAAGPTGEISWHDCQSKELVSVGGVWRGHPWLLDQAAVLAVGSVEPHYFAGFTGAHKTATVGCAAYGDVEANHAHALDPACRPGRLDGNPVYEGVTAMLAALEGRRAVAAVNLVQAETSILAAAGGTCLGTLRRLAGVAERTFIHRIGEPFDAVIAEVAGPLGRTFYQADKGIKNNEWAVRDRGAFVLSAPCDGGVGQDHFVRLLRRAATHERALTIVRERGYRLGDHKAVRLRYLTDPACRGVALWAVAPGLSAGDAEALGLRLAPSVEAALDAAAVGPGGRVLRVRDAGNVCALPRAV